MGSQEVERLACRGLGLTRRALAAVGADQVHAGLISGFDFRVWALMFKVQN